MDDCLVGHPSIPVLHRKSLVPIPDEKMPSNTPVLTFFAVIQAKHKLPDTIQVPKLSAPHTVVYGRHIAKFIRPDGNHPLPWIARLKLFANPA